jgi:hypothetical protein
MAQAADSEAVVGAGTVRRNSHGTSPIRFARGKSVVNFALHSKGGSA